MKKWRKVISFQYVTGFLTKYAIKFTSPNTKINYKLEKNNDYTQEKLSSAEIRSQHFNKNIVQNTHHINLPPQKKRGGGRIS